MEWYSIGWIIFKVEEEGMTRKLAKLQQAAAKLSNPGCLVTFMKHRTAPRSIPSSGTSGSKSLLRNMWRALMNYTMEEGMVEKKESCHIVIHVGLCEQGIPMRIQGKPGSLTKRAILDWILANHLLPTACVRALDGASNNISSPNTSSMSYVKLLSSYLTPWLVKPVPNPWLKLKETNGDPNLATPSNTWFYVHQHATTWSTVIEDLYKSSIETWAIATLAWTCRSFMHYYSPQVMIAQLEVRDPLGDFTLAVDIDFLQIVGELNRRQENRVENDHNDVEDQCSYHIGPYNPNSTPAIQVRMSPMKIEEGVCLHQIMSQNPTWLLEIGFSPKKGLFYFQHQFCGSRFEPFYEELAKAFLQDWLFRVSEIEKSKSHSHIHSKHPHSHIVDGSLQ